MKQKIYDKNNAVHYYEWIHCYCSSIFFRSILENRMLFWINIIRYCSPQVLQVLQHYYKYYWQLVHVFLLIFRSIPLYIRIRSHALSSPINTHSTLILFTRFFLIHARHIVISTHQQRFVVYFILHPVKWPNSVSCVPFPLINIPLAVQLYHFILFYLASIIHIK